MNAKIIGYGYALPEQIVTNQDLTQYMDTSDEWITTRTGIKQRYFSTAENTSDLAYRASQKAIEDAQIKPEDIDLIVVCTFTPDQFTPSTANLLQKKLNLDHENIMAFDLNAACSGFVYGLEVADALLATHHTCLLVGAETISKHLDMKKRSVSILFGDGAGAVILQKSHHGSLVHLNRSLIDHQDVLFARGMPLAQDEQASSDYSLHMQGQEVFRFAVKVLQKAIIDIVQKAQVSLDEIDLIIPHQANQRIISFVAKQLKLDENKFFSNIAQVGNTSAASIPLALAQAKEAGIVHQNMKILLVGFGSGLTYGATYIQL